MTTIPRHRKDHRFLGQYVARRMRNAMDAPACELLRTVYADRVMPVRIPARRLHGHEALVVPSSEATRMHAYELVPHHDPDPDVLRLAWRTTELDVDPGVAETVLSFGVHTPQTIGAIAEALEHACTPVQQTTYRRQPGKTLREGIERTGTTGLKVRADDAAHVGIGYLGSPRLAEHILDNAQALAVRHADAVPGVNGLERIAQIALRRILDTWMAGLFPAEVLSAYRALRTSTSEVVCKSGTAALLALAEGTGQDTERRLQWLEIYPLIGPDVIADPQLDRMVRQGARARKVLDGYLERIDRRNRLTTRERARMRTLARTNTPRKLGKKVNAKHAIIAACMLPDHLLPSTAANWKRLSDSVNHLESWMGQWLPRDDTGARTGCSTRVAIERILTLEMDDERIAQHCQDLTECADEWLKLTRCVVGERNLGMLDWLHNGPKSQLERDLSVLWYGNAAQRVPGIRRARRTARRWHRAMRAIRLATARIEHTNDALKTEIRWQTPDPGLPGVTALCTVTALADEATRMDHCVWDFTQRCLSGWHVYHLSHPGGEATVSVVEPRNKETGHERSTWWVFEVAGPGNQVPDPVVREHGQAIGRRLDGMNHDFEDLERGRQLGRSAQAFIDTLTREDKRLATWKALWEARGIEPPTPDPESFRLRYASQDPDEASAPGMM